MTTLYEKIGGRPGIEKLVQKFYSRVLLDKKLAPFFSNSEIAKLEKMQVAFFSVALGGAETESMISLRESHAGRGIRREHLTRFTELLLETLAEIGIEEQDARRVYERIATYADEILGEATVDG